MTHSTARRPAPKTEGSISTTVNFDPDELLEIDLWLIGMRAETGKRWHKAEIMRELFRMARTPDSPLRHALIRRAAQ
ncbi:hypothetical protein ABZ891_24675 [Streptomyces sp. NPDC047023]|uniref:hypothetical protein n=1 Tax=Streptomyces sp. NPDC047023 TaxID=3155139 RepID=UPI0033FB4A3F